uniref:Putative secreted protein n=1 Tax=Anopheles darlingi TaxID=43151 RepID=A0A2M4D594_ANODA
MEPRFLISSFFLLSLPKICGISLRSSEMRYACTLANRARLMRSFSFRRAAFRGSDCRSRNRSCSSSSNNRRLTSNRSGLSQNEPMYTRATSGVCSTLPSDHISAPYTRISC